MRNAVGTQRLNCYVEVNNGYTRCEALYKYFRTKEEIFLEILSRDIEDWRDFVIAALAKADPGCCADPKAFAQFWFDSFGSRPRLTSILGMLNTTIEKNVSLEKLRGMKRTLRVVFEQLGTVLTETGLFPDIETASEFITVQIALTSGFFPMRDLTENQRKALEAEGWSLDLDSYGIMYIRALAAVVEKLRS